MTCTAPCNVCQATWHETSRAHPAGILAWSISGWPKAAREGVAAMTCSMPAEVTAPKDTKFCSPDRVGHRLLASGIPPADRVRNFRPLQESGEHWAPASGCCSAWKAWPAAGLLPHEHFLHQSGPVILVHMVFSIEPSSHQAPHSLELPRDHLACPPNVACPCLYMIDNVISWSACCVLDQCKLRRLFY